MLVVRAMDINVPGSQHIGHLSTSLLNESHFRTNDENIGYEIFGHDLPSPTMHGEEFVKDLERLLDEVFEHSPNISELYFTNCDFLNLSYELVNKIAEKLSMLSCQTLKFSECKINFSAFTKIQSNRSIKTLYFQDMNFNQEDSQRFLECIGFSIQELQFDNCKFSNLDFIQECREKGIKEMFFSLCDNITPNMIKKLSDTLKCYPVDSLPNVPDSIRMKLQFYFDNDDMNWYFIDMDRVMRRFRRPNGLEDIDVFISQIDSDDE